MLQMPEAGKEWAERSKKMMDYITFKKEVESKIMGFMPEEMKGREVKFRQVDKVNRTLDAVSVNFGSTANEKGATIYINDMYETYKRCGDFGAAVSMSLLQLRQAVQTDRVELPDMTTAKDNIVLQIINTRQNPKLLGGIPNREFLDLSIIYRWVIQLDKEGFKNTIVTNKLANDLGLTERELFLLAKENTKRLFTPTVKSMADIVRDLLPSDVLGTIPEEFWNDNNLWVLTNERGINGAAAILYEDVLHAIAGQLGADLYIIPSSIHEVIVTPDKMDPHELADMVFSINREQVDVEERLSDNVYRYDRETHEFSLAAGMPDKGLEKLGKLWGITQ